MKILHIIPNLDIGGTEKILLELCRGLDSRQFQHLVLSLKAGGQTEQELRRLSVPVEILNSADSFGLGLADLPRLYFRIRQTIKNFGPDILHTWLSRANVIGRIAAQGTGVPSVISSLRVMEIEKNYHLWSEYFTHSLADKVTVNCTALEKFAIQKIKIPKEKIVLIYNGIEVPKNLSSAGSQTRKEWVIGTIGRLHRQKGVDIFLHAAKEVLNQYPQCKFLIAGDGPEKENLKLLAQRLGIQSQVVFHGWVQPSSDFISSLDIFVLTSRWEGMPNVILEAMAFQKPIVSSAVGGVTDLLENQKEGLMFQPEDVQSCAQSIKTLIENEQLRKQISLSAYEKVRKKFSLEQMISSYQVLYESTAKRY